MDKAEDKPIVNWEDIATCTCGHFCSEHYFFEVVEIKHFKPDNGIDFSWRDNDYVRFTGPFLLSGNIKYKYFTNRFIVYDRRAYCTKCDCIEFKQTKPDYSDIIHKAEEQLEERVDNCTITCYPIGVLCKKFCDDLQLPQECFIYCKELIKKARNEGWFQYFFGKNRVSMAIALVYIADKTKTNTFITQHIYETLSGLSWSGVRKHVNKIRKFLELPECKVVK